MEPNGTNDNRVTTVTCRAGCGFYGSIACEGLCSKCYADLVKSRRERSEKMGDQSSELSGSSRVQMTNVEIKNDRKPEASEMREALRRASITENSSNPTSSDSILSGSDTPAVAENTFNTAAAAASAAAAATGDCSMSQLEAVINELTSSAAAENCSNTGAEVNASIATDIKSKKRNRCHTCNKKVGLTGFPCRCGGLYCSLHRYSDTHACTFNYREAAQEDIRKNNPVVVGEKIKKI